ncbi:MAG: von Willebrand factor type A domain-containing protein [Immundisolibacterales bacterium]|nr:von Willebrand factor type A domain-containing protein [Immundisolibacterales bacterium]
MSDGMGRLKSALGVTAPRAPAPARERAMAAAMAAFDRHHQGSSDGARHKGEVPERGTSWMRRLLMPPSRPSLALAGVAGLVLLAGVVVHLTTIAPPDAPEFVLAPADIGPPQAGPGASRPESAYDFYTLKPDLSAGKQAESLHARAKELARREATNAAQARVRERRWSVEAPARAPVATAAPPSRAASSLDSATEAVGSAGGEEHISTTTSETAPADRESFRADYREQVRDRFADVEVSPVKVVAEEPVSTFSIDVDTASYGFVRASLNGGVLPPRDAVRVEELVNYFPYDYPGPGNREAPFEASVWLMPAPWNDAARLMHIGIRGYALDTGAAPRANLVFLVDTSGSMDAPNKLPLLVNSLKLLLGALAPEDRVAIVTYAGSAGTVLPPTPVTEGGRILAALDRLDAGGSTAGAEGIRQAYLLAERHFVEGGVNRVILATDGDFNVGVTSLEELESFVSRKRAGGVFLSVLGFGMGNYRDDLMQRLAQHGNGNAAYIDSLTEARKALVEEATSMLFPIAKDVKIQVEFNPAAISEYRLIGYETRMLAREDFGNDRVDAGEIGSGHTVTALYEVIPAGSGAERVAPLRYARAPAAGAAGELEDELAFVKIRYKLPDADTSTLISRPVIPADILESLDTAPREARFAAAVAAFGQLLRGGRYTGDYGYDDVIALAQGARGDDPFGYRAELVNLVRLAQSAAALEPLGQ